MSTQAAMDGIVQQSDLAPATKHHYFITSEELARFAHERGVQIITPAESITRSTVSCHDLAKLPKISSFLGLAGEIRNLIYEQLLCFEEGQLTCFPQILATNKQVHQEAHGILYGKNQIQLQLAFGGIFVHGKSTGQYQESRFGSRTARSRSTAMRDIDDIKWPVFLRQVESLRLSITDVHVSDFIDVRKVSTENVLYSLCMFLANNHKLKTLSIDLRRRDRKGKVLAQTADLHSLLLLDPLPKLRVDGNGGDVPQLAVANDVDLRKIARLSMKQCVVFNRACEDFAQTLISQQGIHTRDQDLLDAFTMMISYAFQVHIEPASESAKLSKKVAAKCFVKFMGQVRSAMEQLDIPLHGPIINALDALLHFDVDVKVAQRAAEKHALEMETDE